MTWPNTPGRFGFVLVIVGVFCGLVALVLGLFTHELRTAIDFAGGGIVALGAALLV